MVPGDQAMKSNRPSSSLIDCSFLPGSRSLPRDTGTPAKYLRFDRQVGLTLPLMLPCAATIDETLTTKPKTAAAIVATC